MENRDYGLLLILAAIWGLSYVFIRIAAPVVGPALLMELRVGLAAGVMLAYVLVTDRSRSPLREFRNHLRAYFVLGAINAAVPFTLIAVAELNLNASYAALLNSTAPLFSTFVATLWLRDSFSARRAAGLGIGIAGVAVAVGIAPFALTPILFLSVACSLVAALSYGSGALFAQQRFLSTPPLTLSLGQQIAAMAWLTPFAAVSLPSARFPLPAVESVLGLALLSTVVAYLLYFHLLQKSSPTEALTVTFLTPVFGIFWGHLLLGDPIGLGTVAGLGIVLVGVALVTNLRGRSVIRRASTDS